MKKTTLGSLIRSLRKQNDLTQAALAELVGVTDKAVSKWERGISYPDISLFPKLAGVLGVTSDDLLREFADESQPSGLSQIFEMSHDIRTPLHIVLGCVDLAESHVDDTELLTRYLKSIRVSGEYLLQTINRALYLTYPDPAEDGSKKYSEVLSGLSEYLKVRTNEADGRTLPETYDFSGRRILVAEDIELNREIARGILERTGAAVSFACDGEECLKMIEEASPDHFDLILMDIQMPNMDGIEATKRIRLLDDPDKALIPIIAMTANVYDKDRDAAFQAGMDAFTEKPIFIEKLLDAMDQYL